MIRISSDAYDALLGNIGKDAFHASSGCIGQCTGCKCSCKCSCYVGDGSDLDWEVI